MTRHSQFIIISKAEARETLFFPPPSLLVAYYFVRYQLIAALRRQQDRSCTDTRGQKYRNGPADRAQDPGDVKFPAGEEAVVVVVEVGLLGDNALVGLDEKCSIYETQRLTPSLPPLPSRISKIKRKRTHNYSHPRTLQCRTKHMQPT